MMRYTRAILGGLKQTVLYPELIDSRMWGTQPARSARKTSSAGSTSLILFDCEFQSNYVGWLESSGKAPRAVANFERWFDPATCESVALRAAMKRDGSLPFTFGAARGGGIVFPGT